MTNSRCALAGLTLALLATSPASAQETTLSDEDVGALVREVRELRSHVKRLTDRVDELEGEQARGKAGVDALAAEIEHLRASTGDASTPGRSPILMATTGFQLSGTAEMLYSVNPRGGSDSPTDKNRFRAGDDNANSFALQTVQLVLEREATDAGTWGLRVQGEYGRVAELIEGDGSDDGGEFSLSEWFATWRAEGLFYGTDDHRAGRFQSPLGYESNENDKNVMVTRNPIYQLGTPTTHTGVRSAITIAPDLTATVYFVNGWDNQIDGDTGKTGIVSLTTREIADWYGSAFALNGSYGHEGSEESHLGDKTAFGEFLWTANPTDDWSTALDVIWASTDDGVTRSGRIRDRDWHGAAAYVSHQCEEDVKLSGRLGYYSDDGFGAGTIRMMDASIAIRYQLALGFTVMLEFRHDWSPNSRPYHSDSRPRSKKTQDTVTGSVLVEF